MMDDKAQTAENNDDVLSQHGYEIKESFRFLEDCKDLETEQVYDKMHFLWNISGFIDSNPALGDYLAEQAGEHLKLFEKFWYGLTENFGSRFPDCCRNPKKDILKGLLSKGIFKRVFKKERPSRYDTSFEGDLQWPEGEEDQVASICTSFLWYIANITSYSDKVCREFGQINYLQMLLRGLQTDILPTGFVYTITGIIYNCCRRIPENCILCKNGIKTLTDLSESSITEIQSVALLSLAYIIDKSDIKKISLNKSCTKFLLNALKKALDDPNRLADDYAVDELLQGLHQLAINDSNKRLIAEHGGIQLLESVLTSNEGTNKEKCFAAQGIWQLSFIDKIKLKIRRRKDLMKGKSFNIISSHYGLSLRLNNSLKIKKRITSIRLT